ncbi:hypothetical protein [Aurantiacibacter aquimixticola]|nr:hypothetical protein [Aurantiacibacter aquimixticola]
MKRFALTAATIAAFAAAPAAAQDAGVAIVGNDDAEIGTVLSNDGTTVVVDTGTHQVPLGTEAFAEREGVWTLNTTKTELDAAFGQLVAEQQVALEAALVVGAEVKTADAQALGTIDEINDNGIVVTHMDQPMNLQRDMFALDQDGALIVLAEMAAIMEALAATAG